MVIMKEEARIEDAEIEELAIALTLKRLGIPTMVLERYEGL